MVKLENKKRLCRLIQAIKTKNEEMINRECLCPRSEDYIPVHMLPMQHESHFISRPYELPDLQELLDND